MPRMAGPGKGVYAGVCLNPAKYRFVVNFEVAPLASDFASNSLAVDVRVDQYPFVAEIYIGNIA